MTVLHLLTHAAYGLIWPAQLWEFAQLRSRWRALLNLADRVALWVYGAACVAWAWDTVDITATEHGWALLLAPLFAWNAIYYGRRWLEIWRRRRRKRPQRAAGRVIDLGHRLAVEPT